MNERVKELAEQAGFVSWSDEEWKPEGAVIDWSSDYDNELAKFAELIVQESCYKLIEMHEKVNGDHNYYHHASVQLKQHFGVE